MKKLLVITASVLLSACACFEPVDEEPVVQKEPEVQVVAAEPVENVRVVRRRVRVYDDGYTAPRRVRRIYYHDAASGGEYRPEPRSMYRQSEAAPEQYCDDYGNSECPAKVRVVREPVEVVYRKTKYTTVYEPRTFKDVSYEREPYAESSCNDCMD
ncbi:MAG: hypothetical protein IJX20_00215 [Alphaproteobacteria bacterium]|nr:hypothetical protein [Alphaproteobacteria bacterium]